MELRELYEERTEYLKEYRRRYKEKMISLVEECGLYGVDVIADNIKGVIRIEQDYGDNFKIVFYPYTKSGTVSKKAHYVYTGVSDYKSDEENKKRIKEAFTLAEQEGKV